MKAKRKALVMAMSMVLVALCAVGGTLAYLTTKTDEVKNTFTVGNIDITLTETTGSEYKMVPGNTIAKDPKVTVTAGSEDCWLFVKVEESEKFNDYIDYNVIPNNEITGESGWELLGDSYPGVYYRKVTSSNSAQPFYVLTNNEVTVKETVTKKMMDSITKKEVENPTLTFTAYAVQKANIDSAKDAWKVANGESIAQK